MNRKRPPTNRLTLSVVGMMAALSVSCPARADDGVTLEKKVRLINSMVENRALTRERADVMIKEAQREAAVSEALKRGSGSAAQDTGGKMASSAETAAQIRREIFAEMKSQLADEIKRQVLAELTGAGSATPPAAPPSGVSGGNAAAADAATDKAKPRVVRVPYVPETMRREIQEQVKREVLTQAKEERWGNPGALPEWLDRFQFDGDVRLRHDAFKLGQGNTPAGIADNVSGTGLTRGADLVGTSGNFSGVPNVNTQENFGRTRLRLRLGVNAQVAETVSAGLRISTGNTTGPTSTNQTLGQGLNKYALVLDRGYLTYKPWSWVSISGGRIANPFFSTDMVWAEDLNFEGMAASFSRAVMPDLTAFGTVGWFPLRTDNPLQTNSRDLKGLQAGVNWRFAPTSSLKLGAAIYSYRGIEGALENDNRFGPPSASDYGTRYEYPNGLRQRGNTLFVTNALADPLSGNTYWGLASGFRELNLTGSLELAKFDPVHVVLTADYVRNIAFDRRKIATRTGVDIIDGDNYGYLGRITVGYPTITRRGNWSASLAYRRLGSDAVVDAFTNSDFGLGGTNNKGYILGGSLGIDKNAWLSVRWMSSQLINSMAPKVSAPQTSTKFSVDLLQIDLNAKF